MALKEKSRTWLFQVMMGMGLQILVPKTGMEQGKQTGPANSALHLG